MKTRAFTIIELLVVIAIIAILAAFIFPVFVSAKNAVHIMGVGRAGKQIFTATMMYQTDHDDTFPLAMYADGAVMQTWFGRQTDKFEYDSTQGLISPYLKGKLGKDPTLNAEEWMGNDLGLGYNWGVVGSDFHERLDYSGFPNCTGAANSSQFADSSRTVLFATSAFYNMKWLPNGTGFKHKFNFIDPMEFWNNNPNVDFRHRGTVKIDEKKQTVTSDGTAVFIFADGSVKNYKKTALDPNWFWRHPYTPN